MVTIAQARSQIAAQRAELQARERQIKDIALRKLTREELGKRTRAELLQRTKQEQALSAQKEQAIEVLKPYEKQLETAEKEIGRVESAMAEQRKIWKEAKYHFYERTPVFMVQDSSVRKTLQLMYGKGSIEAAEAARKEIELIETPKIESTELKPIYRNGVLVGYDDPVRKMSILPEFYKGIPFPTFEFLIPEYERLRKLGITPPTPSPICSVGVIEDIREPIPTVVSPLKPLPERVMFRISAALTEAGMMGKEKVRDFAGALSTLTTVPASLVEEQRVESINLPSIPGGTQMTRPVDFQDIDTGVLPPMQNLELKSTKILTDFSLGKISENYALQKLEKAQDQYIWEESKRTAALRFIENAGIGALTVLAPPIGFSIIGVSGADAIARRKEIIAFAKAHPKAAALQFAAGVAGGMVGAGVVSMLKTKAVKFKEPTIKLVGKSRIKLINKILENLEPDQRIEFAVMKKTATRAFEIDIPSPKNKVSLKIVEFTKNGKKMFAGLEFVDGKVRTGVGGLSFAKGTGGDAQIITRSIRLHTKKGLTNLEMAEYLERVSTKAVKSKGLKSIALTENEVKLAKMFDLKGLTPDQVREILRRPLFGAKEAQKRMNVPFTDAEFKSAVKISKSKFITSRDIVKTRLTSLNEQLGPLLAERDIVDIRVVERGIGTVDIEFNLPKPVIKIKPKIGEVRVPGKVRGIGIIIKKSKLPERTPLSRTFTKKTDTILLKKISSGEKIRQLQKLKQEVSPVGAYKSIAKTIQQERINLAIKQAQGKALVTGVITGIKTTEKTRELIKEKQSQLIKQLSKPKDGQSIVLVSPTIVKEAEKLAIAGKITPLQLQALKTKLILKQRLITPAARVPTKAPRLPIVVPIIKIPKGVSPTKTVKALIGLGKQGVDIVIGLKERKQKIIRKNLPPFKAFKFGREFVDKNIEASYKLVPSGKKARGKDIKPFNVGMKFRPSKVNPLFLVEKRKYRLDSPLEKAQIRRARRLTPRKKVKTRKRRK